MSAFLNPIGIRYWSASILPALAGTTLPFWLNPPGFHFKPVPAIAFLIAAIFCHAGFVLLYNGFNPGPVKHWTQKQLFFAGMISLVVCTLTGLYLNRSLPVHHNVPGYIFLVYGIAVLFTGILYVLPPLSFYKRPFGAMIISIGLGMMPVLGAYLVQVGDLTRTVYIASIPIVVATALWYWLIELINKPENERLNYNSLVMNFPLKFSSRYITLSLILLSYASLVLAVFVRSSLNPLSLVAMVSGFYALKLIKTIWKEYADEERLQKARKYAIFIHSIICIAIIASSFLSRFHSQ